MGVFTILIGAAGIIPTILIGARVITVQDIGVVPGVSGLDHFILHTAMVLDMELLCILIFTEVADGIILITFILTETIISDKTLLIIPDEEMQ